MNHWTAATLCIVSGLIIGFIVVTALWLRHVGRIPRKAAFWLLPGFGTMLVAIVVSDADWLSSVKAAGVVFAVIAAAFLLKFVKVWWNHPTTSS